MVEFESWFSLTTIIRYMMQAEMKDYYFVIITHSPYNKKLNAFK